MRPCGLHCADSCIKSRIAGDCSSRRRISASVSCFTLVLTIQVVLVPRSGYSEAETVCWVSSVTKDARRFARLDVEASLWHWST